MALFDGDVDLCSAVLVRAVGRIHELEDPGCRQDAQDHGGCKGVQTKVHFDIRHGAQPDGHDEQRCHEDIQHGPFPVLRDPMKDFHVPARIRDQTIYNPKKEQELEKGQYNTESEDQDKEYRVTFRQELKQPGDDGNLARKYEEFLKGENRGKYTGQKQDKRQ